MADSADQVKEEEMVEEEEEEEEEESTATEESQPGETKGKAESRTGSCTGFVMKGGVKCAVVHKTPPKPAPPKPKPPKTTYEQSFSPAKKNQHGKLVEPYRPNALRSLNPQIPTVKPVVNASSIQFEDQTHPTKPREQFKTTYQHEIGGKK